MGFRIKIATLNNGEKRYSVQQSHLKITRGWLIRTELVWEDIFKNLLTEEEAMDAVKNYRSYYEQKKLEEVKSVTYKEIK